MARKPWPRGCCKPGSRWVAVTQGSALMSQPSTETSSPISTLPLPRLLGIPSLGCDCISCLRPLQLPSAPSPRSCIPVLTSIPYWTGSRRPFLRLRVPSTTIISSASFPTRSSPRVLAPVASTLSPMSGLPCLVLRSGFQAPSLAHTRLPATAPPRAWLPGERRPGGNTLLSARTGSARRNSSSSSSGGGGGSRSRGRGHGGKAAAAMAGQARRARRARTAGRGRWEPRAALRARGRLQLCPRGAPPASCSPPRAPSRAAGGGVRVEGGHPALRGQLATVPLPLGGSPKGIPVQTQKRDLFGAAGAAGAVRGAPAAHTCGGPVLCGTLGVSVYLFESRFPRV